MGLGAGLRAVKRRSLTRASVAVAVAAGLALVGACGGSDGDGDGDGDGGLAVGVLLPGAGPRASDSSTDPCSCSS